MLRMPVGGELGLVCLAVLWLMPLTLLVLRVRALWRRWSRELPVLVPPLHHEHPDNQSFPRCLPDPSPVPRSKRLESSYR